MIEVLRVEARAFFRQNKFVGKKRMARYEPHNEKSIFHKIVSVADIPGGRINQNLFTGKVMPIWNKCLQEERSKYETAFRKGYMRECGVACLMFVLTNS